MTKTKRRPKKQAGDQFAKDKIVGEWEKPGPQTDPEGAQIAAALSKITGREKTGFVTSWLPLWAKRAKLPPFTFFFFEDGLAVDTFNRKAEEMDALADDLTPEQRQEISHKTVLCQEHGVAYLHLGPDDELDAVQLAAKIGKTKFKKGARTARAGAEEGITEEEA